MPVRARRGDWWGWVLTGAMLLAPMMARPSRADDVAPRADAAPAAAAEAEAEAKPAASPATGLSEQDYELFRLLVDTLDQVERNYVKPVDRRELIEAAIKGVVGKLDPYSNYIDPKELDGFKVSVESKFGGIGLQVSSENGELKVISPLYGTPAYKAGVQAGDVITHILGEQAGGISVEQAVTRLKGEPGTDVAITVRRLDGKSDEIKMKREIIRVETVVGHHHKADDHWEFMLDHEHKIAYIAVNTFSRDTTSDMKETLNALKAQGMQALVLDLRFNPGGLLGSAIEVCDLFLGDGRIVSTAGRNVKEQVWTASKNSEFEALPMVILVNKYSASASEIVSACLQDHERAIVIGERSWGKGSVQNVIELEGGKSALKLTTAGYLRPSGKNIHRHPDAKETDEWGVSPNKDFEIKLSPEETLALGEYRRNRARIDRKAEAKVEEPKAEEKQEEPQAPEPKEEAKQEEPQADEPTEEKKPEEAKPEEAKADPNMPSTFVDKQLKSALDYLRGKLQKGEAEKSTAQAPATK